MLEIFLLNLVRLIAEMPLSANLFRLGSSIQKHAVSSGAAPVGPPIIQKKIENKNLGKINLKNFLKKKYPS